ncbi:MAG: hypothetical protein WCO86_14595 [Planctomycetota bacterium]
MNLLVQDLATELRPQIDVLTDELLELLVQIDSSNDDAKQSNAYLMRKTALNRPVLLIALSP